MNPPESLPLSGYPHCRFDSPLWVGELLVQALGDLYAGVPRSMIDLGCGAGVLSAAALRRWPSVDVTTVDVDTTVRIEINTLLGSYVGATHQHLVADVLDGSLAEEGLGSKVDLVLSNPPYRSVGWAAGLGQVLERAGLPQPSTQHGEIPADLVFLARAMNLVRPSGSLGLILPDSLITGARMRYYRSRLLACHGVRRVIQLPRRAFKNTDAQAFVVIIERDGCPSPIKLDRVRTDGTWLPCRWIKPEAGVERLDHAYHDHTIESQGRVLIGDLDVEVRRGRISRTEASRLGLNVFHTTNFPATGGGISFDMEDGRPGATKASKGDLLIARIHRKLETKIALVMSGDREITDCIYRLRGSTSVIERIAQALLSPTGQAQIEALTRGTGAKHLSKHNLKSIVV